MSSSLHCRCQLFVYGACKCVLTDCCSSLDVTSVKHADMVCICRCMVCVCACVCACVRVSVCVFVHVMCVCITFVFDFILCGYYLVGSHSYQTRLLIRSFRAVTSFRSVMCVIDSQVYLSKSLH